jgi:hypothetical protein
VRCATQVRCAAFDPPPEWTCGPVCALPPRRHHVDDSERGDNSTCTRNGQAEMHPVHSTPPQLSDTLEVQLRVFPLSFS